MNDIVELKDNMKIVSASNEHIKLADGTVIKVGQRVRLPPVAGRHFAYLHSVFLMFDPEEMTAELQYRFVDDQNEGHVFQCPLDEDDDVTLKGRLH